MRVNWNIILSTGRSDPLQLDGLDWPLHVRVHPRARHVRLRLDEPRARLVLTMPHRMSRRAALAWARGQAGWANDLIRKVASAVPFQPGTSIPFRGQPTELRWQEDSPRTPRMEGAAITAGGPIESFAARIERFLKSEARRLLSEATAAAAVRAGTTVRAVSVGDATSRWGSCSASGAIRYNWRLILAPPHVLEWVVAHEVAHRLHMNHGAAFKEVERQLYEGDPVAARADLRALGPGLKRIGRLG